MNLCLYWTYISVDGTYNELFQIAVSAHSSSGIPYLASDADGQRTFLWVFNQTTEVIETTSFSSRNKTTSCYLEEEEN